MIIEYDDAKQGFLPELSFGSHMFQDLVESEIFYTALFSSGANRSVFHPELLTPYRLPESEDCPERLRGVVTVYDISGSDLTLYHNMTDGRSICAIEKSIVTHS